MIWNDEENIEEGSIMDATDIASYTQGTNLGRFVECGRHSFISENIHELFKLDHMGMIMVKELHQWLFFQWTATERNA